MIHITRSSVPNRLKPVYPVCGKVQIAYTLRNAMKSRSIKSGMGDCFIISINSRFIPKFIVYKICRRLCLGNLNTDGKLQQVIFEIKLICPRRSARLPIDYEVNAMPQFVAKLRSNILFTLLVCNIILICFATLFIFILVKSGSGGIKLSDIHPALPPYRIIDQVVARGIALASTIISAIVFYFAQKPDTQFITRPRTILAAVIIVGTLTRLFLASSTFGNYDMESFYIVNHIVSLGGNVYLETARYNYSPVWFSLLNLINVIVPSLPLFLKIRWFLTGVDLATVVVLTLILREQRKISLVPIILFYLNPVSFLITGYHSQFENIPVLLLLVGILFYLREQNRSQKHGITLWVFATLGVIIKHDIIFQLIMSVTRTSYRRRVRFLLVCISGILFLLTFLPFIKDALQPIILHVFLYDSGESLYGLTLLIQYQPLFRNLFIICVLIYPMFVKTDDIIVHALMCYLFFLTFTTGIAEHYFVMPLAVGALLLPSSGFLIYTALASAFLLGSPNNMIIPGFASLKISLVWFGAAYWFIQMHFKIELISRKRLYSIAEFIKGRSYLLQKANVSTNDADFAED